MHQIHTTLFLFIKSILCDFILNFVLCTNLNVFVKHFEYEV